MACTVYVCLFHSSENKTIYMDIRLSPLHVMLCIFAYTEGNNIRREIMRRLYKYAYKNDSLTARLVEDISIEMNNGFHSNNSVYRNSFGLKSVNILSI